MYLKTIVFQIQTNEVDHARLIIDYQDTPPRLI
jgi:hypothetical protein